MFFAVAPWLSPWGAVAKTHPKPKPALRLSISPKRYKLTVEVTTKPKATCKLTVSAHKKSVSLPKLKASKHGHATFTWGVPVNAPSGKWTFSVRCTRAGKTYRLKKTVAILTGGDGTDALVEGSSLTPQTPGKGAGAPRVTVSVPDKRGAGDPGDDYPAELKNRALDSVMDQWGEYNRECTSFVAWALATRNGFNMPFYDDATGWGADARSRGYTVNSTPAKGSVAWSPSGHVAYVEDVVGGDVHIEEYNHGYPRNPGTYSSRTVPASNFQYIHFADVSGGGRSAGGGGNSGGGSQPPPIPTAVGPGTRLLGDVTGDHRADAVVMFKDSGTAMVALSVGGQHTFAGPASWSYGHSLNADRYFLADVNGDGMADLIAFYASSGKWQVSLSSGSGFWPETDWAPSGVGVGTTRQFFGDVNGDHRADLVTFDAGTGDWYVDGSDGAGHFGAPVRWITGHGVGSTDQVLADVTGDGLADAAIWIAGDGSWYVARSVGNAFAYPDHWSFGHGQGTDKRFVADVDGGGRADEIFFHASNGRWYVGSSSGTGFFAPNEWAFGHGVGTDEQFVADVDGDNLADVVTFDEVNGDWWVSLSSGSGFWPPERWATGHGAHS